jgi:ubiquinone/menaquinone biosynthesis C-methylase UbiE
MTGSSPLYLVRLWIETIGFYIMRIFLLPAWMRLLTSRESNSWLSYEELSCLNKQYKTLEKLTPDQEGTYQKKWANRVTKIAQINNSKNILEVGCGNGLAALSLIKTNRAIYAVDIVDLRTAQVKQSDVQFSIGDVCNRLPYQDDTFDLIFSINSFEHFEQPDAALKEFIRVIRPNGLLFLAFSPLYFSPWGLHASRRLGMPYPQLLFSSAIIQEFINQNKDAIAHTYSDFADRSKISPFLNGYSLLQYRQLFKAQRYQLKTLAYVEAISLDGVKIIFQYPGLIKTKTSSYINLFVSGIKFIARKRAS